MKKNTNKYKKLKKSKKTRKTYHGGTKKPILYPNNDVYQGDTIIVGGKEVRQGKGFMVYRNVDGNDEEGSEYYARTYLGDWLNDERHGKGIMNYKPNDDNYLRYTGDWVNGKKEGKGKLEFGSDFAHIDATYDGDWSDNFQVGKGKLTWQNRDVYEGDFDVYEDEEYGMIGGPQGEGTIEYGPNDFGYDNYFGEWKNGKKDGTGEMTFTDGRIYEGEWDEDEPRCSRNTYLQGPWYADRTYKPWKCITEDFIRESMDDEIIETDDDIDDYEDDDEEEALEIHKAAAKINLDKYLEIINQPNRDPFSNIKDYVLEKFEPFIREHFPQEKDEMIRKLAEFMNRVDSAREISEMPRNKEVVKKSVDFVLEQPPNFIEEYIKTLIKDCYGAYSGPDGSGISCVPGVIERFYMLVGDIVYQLCPEENVCENKEVYSRLLTLFRKRINKNELTQEWASKYLESDDFKTMTAEERKRHYIDFMRGKYRDMDLLDEHTEKIINDEANAIDYVFDTLQFGGMMRTVYSSSTRKPRYKADLNIKYSKPQKHSKNTRISLKRRSPKKKKTRKVKKSFY